MSLWWRTRVRMLGNTCVPQQGEAALRFLLLGRADGGGEARSTKANCPSLSELGQSGGRRRPAGSASFQTTTWCDLWRASAGAWKVAAAEERTRTPSGGAAMDLVLSPDCPSPEGEGRTSFAAAPPLGPSGAPLGLWSDAERRDGVASDPERGALRAPESRRDSEGVPPFAGGVEVQRVPPSHMPPRKPSEMCPTLVANDQWGGNYAGKKQDGVYATMTLARWVRHMPERNTWGKASAEAHPLRRGIIMRIPWACWVMGFPPDWLDMELPCDQASRGNWRDAERSEGEGQASAPE